MDFYYLGVIALIGLVSLDWSGRLEPLIARSLGWTAWRLSARKRNAALRSVARAFADDVTTTERERVMQGSLRDFWLEILGWLPSASGEATLRGARVEGIEHLERALEAGNGAILWESNGFGARMAAKQVLDRRGYALCQIHGRLNLGGFLTDDATLTWTRRNVVRRIFLGWERRFIRDAIDIPERGAPELGRTLLSLLRENRIVCVAGDGKEGRHRLTLAFLRHEVSFSTGMLTLARISGAPVLPLFALRDGYRGIRVVVCPPLPTAATREWKRQIRECLEQYTDLLESFIRHHPDQYRNWHLLEADRST